MAKKKLPSFLTDPNFDFSDMYADDPPDAATKESPKKSSRTGATKSTKSSEPNSTREENHKAENKLQDRVDELEDELIKYQLENCYLAGFKRNAGEFTYF